MQSSLVIFLNLALIATTALALQATPSSSSSSSSLHYRHREPKRQGVASLTSSRDGANFIKLDSDSNAKISPPALVVCNSGDILSEYHLETLDDIVLSGVSSLEPVPVLLLGQDDCKSTLRKLLLDPGVLESRDHVLPSRPMLATKLKQPACILFSGCDRSSISATIQGIRSWNPPGGSSFPKAIAFAMVVPNALDKPLELLIQEIVNDYSENI